MSGATFCDVKRKTCTVQGTRREFASTSTLCSTWTSDSATVTAQHVGAQPQRTTETTSPAYTPTILFFRYLHPVILKWSTSLHTLYSTGLLLSFLIPPASRALIASALGLLINKDAS